MPNADHDAACTTCGVSVHLGQLGPVEAVALLRDFFVRHEGCLTSIDLGAYARLGRPDAA